ncbi:hypothetical protein K443DRAFT_258712 [Laccaria amethystina LaAM-08-1]|uniref:Uncharacterized protein n=1 Tax=Laccaria amethystina LaAM-08-1 TaxID=1095629 RepID=A0A0C9XHG0_9AGAR|nr:hypothetical protein K443DRAFT_258712 [Laccaria amethystina LaAM-08-1]
MKTKDYIICNITFVNNNRTGCMLAANSFKSSSVISSCSSTHPSSSSSATSSSSPALTVIHSSRSISPASFKSSLVAASNVGSPSSAPSNVCLDLETPCLICRTWEVVKQVGEFFDRRIIIRGVVASNREDLHIFRSSQMRPPN